VIPNPQNTKIYPKKNNTWRVRKLTYLNWMGGGVGSVFKN
jgi:hypothetical protein